MDIEVQTALVEGLAVKVVRGNDYDRIQADGRTIAYANGRKNGVLLDFSNKRAVPPKFRTKAFHVKGDRATFLVDGKNVKKGRELLEWLAA